MTSETSGRKGGNATKKKYGPAYREHYAKIARKRWAKHKKSKK